MTDWDDYGSRNVPDAYEGAIEHDCPTCGAEAGMRCTFEGHRMVGGKPVAATLPRHIPCLPRLVRKTR